MTKHNRLNGNFSEASALATLYHLFNLIRLQVGCHLEQRPECDSPQQQVDAGYHMIVVQLKKAMKQCDCCLVYRFIYFKKIFGELAFFFRNKEGGEWEEHCTEEKVDDDDDV